KLAMGRVLCAGLMSVSDTNGTARIAAGGANRRPAPCVSFGAGSGRVGARRGLAEERGLARPGYQRQLRPWGVLGVRGVPFHLRDDVVLHRRPQLRQAAAV